LTCACEHGAGIEAIESAFKLNRLVFGWDRIRR